MTVLPLADSILRVVVRVQRNYESFGEDPYLSSQMVRSSIRGAQSQARHTSPRARPFQIRTFLTMVVWTGAGCDGDRQALGQQQPGGQPLRRQRQPAR